jgi:RNA polymerase sigma-70 factor (ECF subfamily)
MTNSEVPMASDEPAAPGPSAQADFERFTRRLIGLARRHVDERFQHKVDLEDVVQSAYKSFFLRYGDGALAAEGWDGLWALLTAITVRKCAERVRYYQAECRDLNREQAAHDPASARPWDEALGREPTPDEAVVLAETVAAVLGALDADERAIVELSLQGYATAEISRQLGRAERSVRRLRERVRQQLMRWRDDTTA